MLSNYSDKVLCTNKNVPKMRHHHKLDDCCLAHTEATPEEQDKATDDCIQGYVDQGAIIKKSPTND
jgi:hypothetical protein